MHGLTDQQLIHEYAEHRSDRAFTELARRRVDFVYSAVLRMVCDRHLAEDVTQGVFVALAQNAPQLTSHRVLSAWLHRTAQNLAANAVRADVRRRAREQEAAAMTELLCSEPDAIWEHIAPDLDNALEELNESDREAVLLRYFERKSAHEMAQTLGITDEAAQKRVSRAIERLREFFAKRGVAVGASGLVLAISAHAVQAAPAGLVLTITTAAVSASTAVLTTATATKVIAATTLQKTIIGATLAAAVGAGVYGTRQTWTLRSQRQALQQQQGRLTAQIEDLTRERDDALRQLAAFRDQKERGDRDATELLRLRGEVGVLRRENEELQKALKAVAQKPAQPESDQSAPWSVRDADPALIRSFMPQSVGAYEATSTNPPPHPRRVMVIRGDPANPTTRHQWTKLYFLSDSRSVFKFQPEGGFEAWEKQLQPELGFGPWKKLDCDSSTPKK